jgi:hypothetical protein
VTETVKVGVIGVDAGLCWIGDPCYILHKSEKEKPEAIGTDWPDFVNRLYGNNLCGESSCVVGKQMKYDLGHSGLGVVVSTGYGDGLYPVYAEVKDGRVAKVWVDFMEDSDDDEEVRTVVKVYCVWERCSEDHNYNELLRVYSKEKTAQAYRDARQLGSAGTTWVYAVTEEKVIEG